MMHMINKRLILIFVGLLFILVGCKAITTVEQDLTIHGYTVEENETQSSDEYTEYTIYEGSSIAGYIYEFPTFIKARNYYWDHTLENDATITWIIHNQLIVGAYEQTVIDTIVN